MMSNDLCCICGDDACDELAEGSPVCQMHFGMCYSGYTLDELRAERDNEPMSSEEQGAWDAVRRDMERELYKRMDAEDRAEGEIIDGGWPAPKDGQATVESVYPPELTPIEQAIQWAQEPSGTELGQIIKSGILDLQLERDAAIGRAAKAEAALKPFAQLAVDYGAALADLDSEDYISFEEWMQENISFDGLLNECEAARALKAEGE